MAENSENMDTAENPRNTEPAEGTATGENAEPDEGTEPGEMAAEPTPGPERPAPEPPLTAVGAEPAAPTGPKRRIRTRSLLAAAVALGVVGGAVAGYTIQALRKPTPLPPLAVAQPVYPRSPIYDGTRPPALPANQDDATIVNGDLTKLLLPTPAGATATFLDHSWMDMVSAADTCEDSASCFSSYLADGVVRIADTAWRRGDGLYVEIRIFQYKPGNTDYVDREVADFNAGNYSKINTPAGIAAAGYEYSDSNHENDDHAVAVHGDLAVYFWVTSSARVPDPSIINDLIQQQMARL